MKQLTDAQKTDMAKVCDGLPTKSAKIRALAAAGFARADIARFLDIRYQHARNVLEQMEEQAEPFQHEQGADALPAEEWMEVTPEGRTSIPTAFRSKLGVEKGGRVLVVHEEGRFKLLSWNDALKDVQEKVKRLVPHGVSMVDELLAERRAEAEKEEREAQEWEKDRR